MKQLLLPVFTILFIFFSCKKKEDSIPVQSVTIDKAPTAHVYLDTTLRLTATVLPKNATSKEVTWDTSDHSVATVSTEGLVSPVKPGEVTVSAAAGGVKATCKVTVLPPFVAVVGISLKPVKVNMVVKNTATLVATAAPENATVKTVEWTSDRDNIATVIKDSNGNGVVTGVALGTCTITAKSVSDPTKTSTCEVTVVDQPIAATAISITPAAATILVDDTRLLAANVLPENATDKNVTWSTSNADVAEVSTTGLVTAKSVGTATVTVTGVSNSDKTTACRVTVTDRGIAVTGLTVTPADTTIALNTGFELKRKIEPANATHVRVTYVSSDPKKATVSSSGWVTAVAKGQATITVKSVANPNRTALCRVTVKDRVQSITVTPNPLELGVGEKRLLNATVMPSDAAAKTVTWSSENTSTATVSQNGEVTAVALGAVRIIATAKDGSRVTGFSAITVVTGVAGISLAPATVSIIVGKTSTVTATIAPPTATNKGVLWISDKENIATVSGGVITAQAIGTCTITAKSAGDPTKTATCAVTVVAQPIAVTEISITPATATIMVNDTRLLAANVLPYNATNKGVTWSTSNANVAEVSTTGLVTAKIVGTATVTATSVSNSDKTAACAITVTNREVAVTGITANPTAHTMPAGEAFQLGHTVEPANATNVAVTYVTGNVNIATVSETGLATGVAAGEVTITIKSVADPNKSATCVLTVTPAPARVQRITLSPEAATVSVGQKQQFTPTVLPADAANKTVTWSSTEASKAAVSTGGEVTALAAGQAVITATANDGSGITGRAAVTVLPKVATITISPANPTVTGREALTLSAAVLPAESVQTVTWSSGDETIATINATTGAVSGVKSGTVTITATATDGSGVKGETRLTVQITLPVSQAAITAFTVRSADFSVTIPTPRPTVTLNNVPRSVGSKLDQVQVEIETTAGAIVKIGTRDFTSGQEINCTNPVTFTVTEAGKSGSKEYILIITPYNKESNPYGIYSAAHLHDMRNALSAGYRLMNDLTMPAASAGLPGISDYGTKGWLPIGDRGSPFEGTLDGAGHKTDNFYSDQGREYAGLFGVLGGSAVIKNLEVNTTREDGKGVTSVNRSGRQYCGILAGQNLGTIEDCHTTGVAASIVYPVNGNAHAGGLVGAHEGGKISRCYSTARVNSNSFLDQCFSGGLVGYNTAEISESYATGNIYAAASGKGGNAISFAGGLAGNCNGGSISKCYATGEIDSHSNAAVAENQPGAYAGGLIGRIGSTAVSNCYALGNVKSATRTAENDNYTFTGGFAGRINASAPVNNCYAAGKVSTDKAVQELIGSFVGYLEAWHTRIAHCYRRYGLITKRGESATPDDINMDGRSIEDMRTDTFRDLINRGLSAAVWWRSEGKNDNLPYLIGVGVGKD